MIVHNLRIMEIFGYARVDGKRVKGFEAENILGALDRGFKKSDIEMKEVNFSVSAEGSREIYIETDAPRGFVDSVMDNMGYKPVDSIRKRQE